MDCQLLRLSPIYSGTALGPLNPTTLKSTFDGYYIWCFYHLKFI